MDAESVALGHLDRKSVYKEYRVAVTAVTLAKLVELVVPI